MKKILIAAIVAFTALTANAQTWVRINQAGYLPDDVKVAVLISLDQTSGEFEVHDAISDKLVFKSCGEKANPTKWALKSAFRLNFSSVTNPGTYYISSNGVKSPVFRIGTDVYDGLADFMLVYLRQQRCGDNPYNDHLCHQHDGYIVYHPTKSGQHIDVTGGWHDATDYLQYMTTSSTTIYHMAFAYKYTKDKSVFKDLYDATGRKGANGIPDILDEVKWGLDWLDKMNPAPREMYYQIADDRDHAGMRLPYQDSVDYGYGKGLGRPVYFVTGKPQIAHQKVNRTTGVSSAAGKFASTFALGADVIKAYYPEFAEKIMGKVQDAYDFALEVPGNTQTACVISPYFYEEDTWVDDIELAAATMFSLTGEKSWEKAAAYWGELEPVSPWMERGRGPGKEYHHYQWYPFINLGHYLLASGAQESISAEFSEYMRQGLQDLRDRAADEPFMHGVPYLWCSNNLTSAAVTQARLYEEATGDTQFREMEAALRDWLLGCNPWGTTMISGYPEVLMPGYDYPSDPHCSYVKVNGDLPVGGLIDGPIYNVLFEDRAGAEILSADEFADLNHGEAVYHDQINDYASNEPTMDGSAGLTYYFAALEELGRKQASASTPVKKDECGAIVRINPDSKKIYLCFTADYNFNGAETILNTLAKNKIKGNFFLTGNCLRSEEQKAVIDRIVAEGHYLGGHSDKHVLYADWGPKRPSLMSADSIICDLKANYEALAKFGITPDKAQWYLPPYEHYNSESVTVLNNMGIKVVNYTPGIGTPADYTTPDMKNYRDAQTLIDGLYKFEKAEGLGGALLLIHPGIVSARPDSERLYNRLGEIVKYLKKKGYTFERLD
ncbi:MAG: glycoside hydrolase family 9 protein [Bacteroidales bacterium]|nr:glycoside hydrolase family 9 protein [Candidatus Cacconaster merdequi]